MKHYVSLFVAALVLSLATQFSAAAPSHTIASHVGAATSISSIKITSGSNVCNVTTDATGIQNPSPNNYTVNGATFGGTCATGILPPPPPPPPSAGTVYYVLPNGGSSVQCNGLANVPYSGTGTNQACAWATPMIALPAPPYGGTVATPLHGGDTLMIGPGQYMIGYGLGSNMGVGNCNTGALSDCRMSPVPSGTATQPTRIIGSCSAQTQLWGTQGNYALLNLTKANNVEVGCLEITDHSSCIVNHCSGSSGCTPPTGTAIPNACPKLTPYNPANTFAGNGIVASDSSNVYLHDLNIHGLGNEGVRSGRLTNWNMLRVRIYANGFGGWDGDIRNGDKSADTSDHGYMDFTDSEIGFSGCGEYYPLPATNAVYGCWGQNEAGYGDGLGTGPTSGNWNFQNVWVHHNSQDGLDLLYGDGTNTVVMNRVRSEGNAGNQLKISGTSTISNSVIIGNCAYLYDPANMGAGWMDAGDMCRAGGDAIAVVPGSNTPLNPPVNIEIVNSTITGQGNGLVVIGSGGNAGSHVKILSNVFYGQQNWRDTLSGFPDQAGSVYIYNSPLSGITASNNVIWNTKDAGTTTVPCTPIPGMACKDPLLTIEALTNFNPMPLATSPLIAGTTAINSTAYDFYNVHRPTNRNGVWGYDIGAVQYVAAPTAPVNSAKKPAKKAVKK